MTVPAIQCSALVKRYGDHVAVHGVDLEVQPGECFGLLGPNGAGKTTTVEILEGLHPPNAGQVRLFGIEWGRGRDRELRERLGVQLQDTQLADKLTVEEVLTLFRSFYSRGREIGELIDLVRLGDERHRRFHQLSGGQKQRVALACALVGDPELLFLDEPTTGLDPRARQDLWAVVRRFRDGGGTIVITTHYMEEAAALCDRIAIMDRGRIIALDTPRSLVDRLGMVQFVEFETQSTLDQEAFATFAAALHIEQRGNRYRLRLERSLSALTKVLQELDRQHVVPVGLSTHQATLDDVFMHLTGRALQNESADAPNSAENTP